MDIFAVTQKVGGFAREDPSSTYVVAAVEDNELAHRIAKTNNGQVHIVRVGHLSKGVLERLTMIYGEEDVAHLQNKSR